LIPVVNLGWSKDPGSTCGGGIPRHYCKDKRGLSVSEKIISVFIDESGDFGQYQRHSPYYIVSMVFHAQQHDISRDVYKLKEHVLQMCDKDTIHTAPIIRSEAVYAHMSIELRHKLFASLCNFTRKVPLKYLCVKIKKIECTDSYTMSSKLSKAISDKLKVKASTLSEADKIIVYYDNGQIELNKIINSVFTAMFENVEFRRVEPMHYTLSQVADLICTMELLAEKAEAKNFSRAETAFFDNLRNFKKSYLNKLRKKLWVDGTL